MPIHSPDVKKHEAMRCTRELEDLVYLLEGLLHRLKPMLLENFVGMRFVGDLLSVALVGLLVYITSLQMLSVTLFAQLEKWAIH